MPRIVKNAQFKFFGAKCGFKVFFCINQKVSKPKIQRAKENNYNSVKHKILSGSTNSNVKI